MPHEITNYKSRVNKSLSIPFRNLDLAIFHIQVLRFPLRRVVVRLPVLVVEILAAAGEGELVKRGDYFRRYNILTQSKEIFQFSR